jgi:hypothetical protein
MRARTRPHPVLHHAARQIAQAQRLHAGAGLRLVFGARQCQQLVDQARGRFRTLGQLFQRAVDFALSVWRSASSDCMRMPASGVRIWCARRR